MGCDIHSVFQKNTEKGWQDIVTDYNEERHYALFSWLAGVRNYPETGIVPISSPRGLPDDFQIEDEDHASTKELMGRRAKWLNDGEAPHIWMGDHSHSWLGADEILSAPRPDVGEHFDYFIDEVTRLKDAHGDVRMVFGFDS